MKITIELLKEKGVCEQGREEFKENYPDGCDYQELLNACAEKGRDDYADWLMTTFGLSNTVLKLNGNYESEHSLFLQEKSYAKEICALKGS